MKSFIPWTMQAPWPLHLLQKQDNHHLGSWSICLVPSRVTFFSIFLGHRHVSWLKNLYSSFLMLSSFGVECCTITLPPLLFLSFWSRVLHYCASSTTVECCSFCLFELSSFFTWPSSIFSSFAQQPLAVILLSLNRFLFSLSIAQPAPTSHELWYLSYLFGTRRLFTFPLLTAFSSLSIGVQFSNGKLSLCFSASGGMLANNVCGYIV